jgi:acyl-CoA reductase-like NAD-dependent aldehyde dehydrogenase
VLELGGKNPLIILEDADPDLAVDAAVFGAFMNSGQLCMSTDRIIIHNSLVETFIPRYVERVDMANNTEYGLTGGVITRDLSAALDAASRVRSRIIHIDDQSIADEPMAPFGGVKNSGCGKFGGTVGIESFAEQRWVTIQHSGRPTYPFHEDP